MAMRMSAPGSSLHSQSRSNLRCFVLAARARVGWVQATDKDFPKSSTVYSISTGGASPQYPKIFWINPKTGELQLVTKVDYETTPIYILRIQATDKEDTNSVTVSGSVAMCSHQPEWLTRGLSGTLQVCL